MNTSPMKAPNKPIKELKLLWHPENLGCTNLKVTIYHSTTFPFSNKYIYLKIIIIIKTNDIRNFHKPKVSQIYAKRSFNISSDDALISGNVAPT